MTRRETRDVAVALLAAAVLVGASLLAWHTLRFDARGWLRWGHELEHGSVFDTSGYPSWKPLALLAALPAAATGAAAPTVWLLIVRVAGLFGLWAVGRLAWRRAGVAAGVVAASLLALAPGWWPAVLGGGIEPLVLALCGGAVLAHERDRPGAALALLLLAALGREEAALVAAGYGLALARRSRALPVAALAGCAGVVAAWLVGDWIGSGDPTHGAELARRAAAELPWTRFTTAEAAIAAVVVPVALACFVAGLRDAARRGDRVLVATASAGAAWAAADAVLGALGYPIPARFVLPAVAAGVIVTGVGFCVLGRRPALEEPAPSLDEPAASLAAGGRSGHPTGSPTAG